MRRERRLRGPELDEALLGLAVPGVEAQPAVVLEREADELAPRRVRSGHVKLYSICMIARRVCVTRHMNDDVADARPRPPPYSLTSL